VRRPGEQGDHAGDDAGHTGQAVGAKIGADRAALGRTVGIQRHQRPPCHAPGGGDRRAGMPRQAHRVGIAVFDQPAFRRAEEFSQRIVQDDPGNCIEEGREFDDRTYCFLTKSMTMLPGSRWR
jgi:hypothetical protein